MRKHSPCILTLAFASLTLSASGAFGSDSCKNILSPEDYLVFSGSNITSHDGDYQGITGAVGDIRVSHFSFRDQQIEACHSPATNLVAGRTVRIRSGGVESGNVEAGQDIQIEDGHVNGDELAYRLGDLRRRKKSWNSSFQHIGFADC